MNGSLILLILAVVPMLCAPLAWALGRKGGQRAIAVMIACSAVEVAALIWLTALAAGGNALRHPHAGGRFPCAVRDDRLGDVAGYVAVQPRLSAA